MMRDPDGPTLLVPEPSYLRRPCLVSRRPIRLAWAPPDATVGLCYDTGMTLCAALCRICVCRVLARIPVQAATRRNRIAQALFRTQGSIVLMSSGSGLCLIQVALAIAHLLRPHSSSRIGHWPQSFHVGRT
jgi:hypothetical protein